MISGEGKHYLVKGSGYDQVQKMDQWSNSNQAGVWMFKIGHIDHNESIKEPKLTSRGEYKYYWVKPEHLIHQSYIFGASLLDNAPNYIVGCIIQKRQCEFWKS